MNISSDIKEVILKMLKYEESERIDWQDLFNFPRFSQLSNEISNMNIMPIIEVKIPDFPMDDLDFEIK